MWQVSGPERAALAGRLLGALDGRQAAAVASSAGLKELAASLALLGDMARSGLLVEADATDLWRVPPAPKLRRGSRKAAITIIAEGDAAAPLRKLLRGAGASVTTRSSARRLPADADLWVAFMLEPALGRLRKTNDAAIKAGVAWLWAVPVCGEFLVGPVAVPGRSACWRCVELRRMGIAEAVAAERALLERLAAGPSSERLPRRLAEQLVAHVAAAALDWLEGKSPRGELQLLDLLGGHRSSHRVLPHPLCDRCPAGGGGTKGVLRARDFFRGAAASPLDVLGRRLRPLSDDRFGIVGGVAADTEAGASGLYTATARFAIPFPEEVSGDNTNTSAGIADTLSAASLLARVEGVERYCALSGSRAVVAPYNDVAPRALHPELLPLYAAEQYAEPGFPFAPFDPTAPLSWVEGFNLTTGRVCLVPHDAAYCAPTFDRLLMESTNGVAAHTTRRDALTSALLELVERDAFMVHWLHRISPPVVDASTLGGAAREMLGELERGGYSAAVLDVTTDVGVPAALALARRDDRVAPALIVGGGSSLDRLMACEKALKEAVGALRSWARRPRALEEPLRDSDVRLIADHARAYAHPSWLRRAEFLWSSPRRRRLDEMPRPPLGRPEPCALRVLMGMLHARGLEVVAVDLTKPEVAASGLYVVRAVVPGLHPIGFGRHGVRLGGRRLREAPRAMGHEPAAELNTTPHCFP